MRDEKELQKLYKDCMNFWGFEKQARVVQEECAELIVATSHILRGRKGSYKKMLEEVADVYIMVHQMMTYFGKDQVMDVVDFKSDRVKAKLERYKKENSNAN